MMMTTFVCQMLTNYCCCFCWLIPSSPQFPLLVLLFLLSLLAILPRQSQAQFPTAYQATCPPGWEQDGTCSGIKFFCISPREVCLQGLCCQPSRNAISTNPLMPCPIGTNQDGACQVSGVCFDPRETCIQGACCQPNNDIYGYGQGGGFGGSYGGYGGFGYGCTDFDASCPYYRNYCFSQAIVEACMQSCGVCGGYGGGGFGGYGMGGIGTLGGGYNGLTSGIGGNLGGGLGSLFGRKK